MLAKKDLMMTTQSILGRKAAIALSASLCISGSALAQTTKLFFNKSQNPENYIILKMTWPIQSNIQPMA